jgi:hypothetical protein
MNLSGRTYHEKRNFIRMQVDTPLEITLKDQGSIQGQCLNLSGGGLLVTLPQALPADTELQVVLSSNHGHNPILKALVKVARVESANQPYRAGLQIVKML